MFHSLSCLSWTPEIPGSRRKWGRKAIYCILNPFLPVFKHPSPPFASVTVPKSLCLAEHACTSPLLRVKLEAPGEQGPTPAAKGTVLRGPQAAATGTAADL